MIKQKLVNRIYKEFRTNKEGFSFSLCGLNKINSDKGFMFAITNIKSKYQKTAIKKLLNCLCGFQHIKNKIFIGGWFFENCYYLDISFFESDLNKCLDYAKFFKQISVFDIQNKNCINC